MNFLLIFNVFVNRQKSLALFAFMEQMDALLQFKVFLNIAPKPYPYPNEIVTSKMIVKNPLILNKSLLFVLLIDFNN
jgi:hypothetical protein